MGGFEGSQELRWHWLRQARAQAEQLRCVASVAAHRMDPMLGPIEPQGSPLADAVEALGVAAAAAVRRGLWAVPPDPVALVLVLSRGLLVAGSGVR